MDKLKKIIIPVLIEIYFIYYFIFLNNWEPAVNVPHGGIFRANIFSIYLIGIFYTLYFIGNIINLFVFKKEFELKEIGRDFFIVFIIMALVNFVFIANATTSFYMKYGDTRESCPAAYSQESTDLLNNAPCPLSKLSYEEAKKVNSKYYPLHALFSNEYITSIFGRI